MKIIVYHSGYGCDTGCCGHITEIVDKKNSDKFEFDHPYGADDPRKFAEQMVRERFGEEHVKDLDWENCRVVKDC